ncbi:hypothetical protein GCM10027403_29400 [Arthrobacter tecti]
MADPAGHGDLPAGHIAGDRRGRTTGRGFVDRVTILPRSAAPRFSAFISDAAHSPGPVTGEPQAATTRYSGTGVRLVWTGQRKIPGIDPGVELAFEGMLSIVDGVPTIYNPRYEIIGRLEETL